MENYILLIDEIEGHPKSLLKKICLGFEKPSIVHFTSERQLSKLKTKPIFSEKYIVIFDSLFLLKQHIDVLNFNLMFPILCIQRKDYDTIIPFLKERHINYKILSNPFTKEDALSYIQENANIELSENKLKLIFRKTGASPKKIMTAISLLNEHGYTLKNIQNLLVSNVFISSFDILTILLGQSSTISSKKKAELLSYVSEYRDAYSYILKELLNELNFLILVFNDILDAVPEHKGISNYIESIPGLTAYKFTKIEDIYKKVSLVEILSLEVFLRKSNILSFITMLGVKL